MSAVRTFRQKVLTDITSNGKEVKFFYAYPETFDKLPVGAFRLASDMDTESDLKKTPYKTENEIYVSLFGESPAELESISTNLVKKANAAGFVKQFLADLPKRDEKYYHREIRFKVNFNTQAYYIL